MTSDQERWAEAGQIEKMYGDRAPLFVAERIGALALVGDAAGVTRFQEVAQRLNKLRRVSTSSAT